ncbi:hypothetical protein ACFY4C_37500 [Actinomadura viridis]
MLGAVMLSPTGLAEVRPQLDPADSYRPAHTRAIVRPQALR